MTSKSPRRKALMIGMTLFAILLGVVLWQVFQDGPAPNQPRAPSTADRTGPSPAPSMPSTLGLPPADAPSLPVHRVGMQAIYEIALASQTHFELGKTMHQQLRDVEVTLAGRWSVTVVAATDREVHLAATLIEPRLVMNPPGDAAKMAVTRRDLASRHYFSMNRHGTVERTHFPKGFDPLARSLLKTVIAASQVTLPDSPATDSWMADEQTLEGDVRVGYGRLPGSGDTIEKRTLQFVRVAALGGPVPASDIGRYTISGRAEIGVDASGWLARRDAAETLRVTPDGGLLSVQERRTSRFQLLQRHEAPELAQDFDRDRLRLVTSTLIDVQRLDANQDMVDRGWVNGASLDTLLAALRSAAAGGEGAQARAQLVPRLAALLRLEPQHAPELASIVRQEGDTKTGQTLLAAMSSAGTPEAQEALAALGTDEALARSQRLRAVGLLGLSKDPTPESGTALLGMMASNQGDLAETAALAVGNHVKKRQEEGGDEAAAGTADLVESLIAKLQAAKTSEERALYLKALGNTADARAVPAILAQLATDDVSIRAVALWALRFMPGSEVEAVLIEALLKDPALAPRQAVVAGAAFRPLDPLGPALDKMARSHPDKALRLDIVHLLGVSKNRYPPGIVTLKWVAQNDGAADVREAAQAALKADTVPGPKLEVVE